MSEQPAFVKGIVEAIKRASDSIHHSPDWWDSSYSDDGMREIDYIEAEIFDQVHKYTAEREARIRELEQEKDRLKKAISDAYEEGWYDGWDAANSDDADQLDDVAAPHNTDWEISKAKQVFDAANQSKAAAEADGGE